MKIKDTKEIRTFIKKCYKNLEANYQNDFLDGYIDQKDEDAAKKELLKAGQLELKDKNISLFINTEEYQNNPYYKKIKLDKIQSDIFSYEKVILDKGYLFNYDTIQDDPDKELKDYMCLRALDKDLLAIFLYQGNKEWMMSVPSESKTNDPYAMKAKGNVLTFGLGIGYFVYMSLLNSEVESITIVEKSKEVINLFKQIQNQFPRFKSIKIINGDAFDYWNEKFLDKFDYIYVDIWQSNQDGRNIITKLLEKYLPNYEKCDFWIEESCLNVVRSLILIHFDEVLSNKKKTINNDYFYLMTKVRKYFDNKKIEINSIEDIKKYLYDNKLRREILSIR